MQPTFKDKTLLFTGDSITDCDHLWDEGDEKLGNGYVRLVSQRFPEANIINRGHNGYTAFQLCARWADDCIRHSPDIVTILVGINDICAHVCGAGGYGAKEFSGYLQQMIRETYEHTAAQIILMEPFLFPKPAEYQNWFPALDSFRAQVRRLAEENHTGFVPLHSIFRQAMETTPIDALTIDGIHVTPLGHRLIADALIPLFQCLKVKIKMQRSMKNNETTL